MFRELILAFFLAASAVFAQDGLSGEEFLPIAETYNISAANVACTIDIHTQTATPQPVFIRPGTSTFFHPANRNGQIQMTANQNMELY